MAIKIDGKVYRNLQEQVLANTRNIEDIIKSVLQPTLTRHYVKLKDVANNRVISATFIFRKSTKFTSMDDFFNTLVGEYGFIPNGLPFFGATGFIYIITIINPTTLSVHGFNMNNASAVVNPKIEFLDDTISTMGNK